MRTICFTLTFVIATALPAMVRAEDETTSAERIQSLSARIEELEKKQDRQTMPDWTRKVKIGGLIEAEAGYNKMAIAGAEDEETSDINLSTMELGFDVDMNEYVGGHIKFLWEEDATEPVDLDEAYISLSGGSRLPFYARAGRFYVPFGRFETRFISDPLTLELGETRESALMIGFATERFDLSAGVFNGDVDKLGGKDNINAYFASAAFSLPENIIPGLSVGAGLSFISNLADSDLLSGQNDMNADGKPDGIRNQVPGISGYVSANFEERIFLEAEYVGATGKFGKNGMDLVGGRRPSAWNTELAYVFPSRWGLGLKYEGSNDTGELLPETRFGAVAFCQPLENTYLGLECLREKYKNGDEGTAVTLQLSYAF